MIMTVTTNTSTTVTTTAGRETRMVGGGSNIYSEITKTNSNTCPATTMVVISSSGVMTNILVKVVDTPPLDLEEAREVLTTTVESQIKILCDI